MTKITVLPVPNADWLHDFANAIERDDIESAVATIDARKTAHAGTANAADKRAAANVVLRAIEARPAEAFRLGRVLAAHASPTARELGAIILVHSYPKHPDETFSLLRALANDDNWEVREWAASTTGELLDQHFDDVHPAIAAWLRDPSQHVRRALAVACMGAADAKHPERCDPLFALLEPLLPDPAEEVRRNLGPFAIGGAMLKRYPDQTEARIRRWSQSEDEMVRWNTAMIFVAAAAANHVDLALEVLSRFAGDKRRLVWMAVGSALKNLVKRDPGRVVPELRTWLKDDRKLPAALALRHTTLDE